MTKERMDELIGKLEVATTDGDLSGFTQDDIGDLYSYLLEQRSQTGAALRGSEAPQLSNELEVAWAIVADKRQHLHEAIQVIEIMLASSHPHPKEHPTMDAAWKTARERLPFLKRAESPHSRGPL